MRSWQRWIPGGVLACGVLLNSTILARRATSTPLVGPITSVAPVALGLAGRDTTVDEESRRVAGMTSYVLRNYESPDGATRFSIYVGYYDEQHQGKSVHSPKNCLPGSGWEPVEQGPITLQSTVGPVTINRYRVAQQGASAIVYYWYQGRGRVAWNEFRVKYELLRDAALYGRTEEALVRVVVPVQEDNVAAADAIARQVAAPLVADVDRILPKL